MSNLTTNLQSISESLGFKPSSIVVENGIAKINFAQRDGSSGRLGVSLRKPLLDAGVTSDAITATADQVCVNFSQGANPARGTYPTSSGSSKLFSVQRFANGNYEMIAGENSVRGGTVVRIGDRQSMMQELRELRGQNDCSWMSMSRTGVNFSKGAKAQFSNPFEKALENINSYALSIRETDPRDYEILVGIVFGIYQEDASKINRMPSLSQGAQSRLFKELAAVRDYQKRFLSSRTGAKSINGVNSDPREFLDPKNFVRLFLEEYENDINGLLDDLDQPKMTRSNTSSIKNILQILTDLKEGADDAGLPLPRRVKEAYQSAVRGRFSRTGAKAEFANDSEEGKIGHYEVTTANRVIKEFEDLYTRCSRKSSLITKQMSIIKDVITSYSRALRANNYNLYRDAEYLSESVDRQLTASFSRTGAKATHARPSLQAVLKSIDDYRASGASEAAVQQYSETVLRAWQAESGR